MCANFGFAALERDHSMAEGGATVVAKMKAARPGSRATEHHSCGEGAPGAAKAGLASLMRPMRRAPGRAVRQVPLRRDPNDAAAIIAVKLARWRHVLSSILVLPGRLVSDRGPCKRPPIGKYCQIKFAARYAAGSIADPIIKLNRTLDTMM